MSTRLLVLGLAAVLRLGAADSGLEQGLAQTVRPFLASYCLACHSGASPAAQFDLGAYSDMAAVVRDYGRWNRVVEKLSAGEMPPKPMKQPPA
ncbi:MAG TPA: c-type cytochrome domain-containing protein, partial [Candidatus Sulfopaludibacter sp.]|nr:c-type cytochrome domain-containing protein [Candidatus Sulfopaludibacter sp.]